MGEIRVTMTELRHKLGTLVNHAAYGGARIVLLSRGEPKAAIIGVEDLQRLKQLSAEPSSQPDRYAQALATADLVRERIRRWQEAHGITPEDTVETLRRLQERRDDELAGLR